MPSNYNTELVSSQYLLKTDGVQPKHSRISATVLTLDEVPEEFRSSINTGAVKSFPDYIVKEINESGKSGKWSEKIKFFVVTDDKTINHGGIKSLQANGKYYFDITIGCRNNDHQHIKIDDGRYRLNRQGRYIQEENLLAVQHKVYGFASKNGSKDIIDQREVWNAQMLIVTCYSVLVSLGMFSQIMKQFEPKSLYVSPPNLMEKLVERDDRITEECKKEFIDKACVPDESCELNDQDLLKIDPMYKLVLARNVNGTIELYFRVVKATKVLVESEEEEIGLSWCHPPVSTTLSQKSNGYCCIAILALVLRLGVSPVHPQTDPPHNLFYRNKRTNEDQLVRANGTGMIRISSLIYFQNGITTDCIGQQDLFSLGPPSEALAQTGVTGNIYPCQFSIDEEAKELKKELSKMLDDTFRTATKLAKKNDIEKLQKMKKCLIELEKLKL